MKAKGLFVVTLFFVLPCPALDNLAQWNFNSSTLTPSVGFGTASGIGGVGTSGFFTGASSDPATLSNLAWSTDGYPTVTNGNRTAGVRFDVSTVDYENITVSWSQKHSSTASHFVRFQYTLDGVNFINGPFIAIDNLNFTNKVVSLAAVPGVTNNPLFAFQLVTEFENSALGSGTNAYVGTTGGYSTAGTIRYDMVTVSGTLRAGANNPPHLSAIPDQTVRVEQSTGPAVFNVWDYEDPAANLTLDKTSSDPAVVPPGNIQFGGSGGNRTIAVTAGSQPGTSLITVFVNDSGGKSASTNFTVTVLPLNTPPSISVIPATNTISGVPSAALAFTVGDLETPASSLSLAGTSANTVLVPNANITFGGSDANRTVTVTPTLGQAGAVPITVTVSDGTNQASTTFGLMVTPSASVVVYEPFSYADGSLLTNSGFLWDNRSGPVGECAVTAGQLQITGDQTEDVVTTLAGGPYDIGHQTALYAAFKVRFLSLPKRPPGYFAHFVSGTSLRGRVFAGTTNAPAGTFRLQVANGSDTWTNLAVNLVTNTTYTVVTRYLVDTAVTTLWVNPTNENAAGVSASDSFAGAKISTFGFRQDADVGATLLIDDVKVGLSFAAVTGIGTVSPIPLQLGWISGNPVLSWTNSSFVLQAASTVTGPFTNIPGAVSPYTNSAAGPMKFYRLRAN